MSNEEVRYTCATIKVLKRLFQYVGRQGFYNVGGYFDSNLYDTVVKLVDVKDCITCPLRDGCIIYTYQF